MSVESAGGGAEAVVAVSEARLRENIGQLFPNLTLIDRQGAVVRMTSFQGKRVAVLVAISPCPTSVLWMKELQASNWRPPPGFDQLIVLIATGADHEWNSLVRACPEAYLVGWPLIDYLSYVTWQPAMLAVGRTGRFEGFWNRGASPVAPDVGS